MAGKRNDCRKDPYQCDVCSEEFTNLDSFTLHKGGYENKDFFLCNKWKDLFTADNHLNDHLDNDKYVQKAPEALTDACSGSTVLDCGTLKQEDVQMEYQKIKTSSSVEEDCTYNKSLNGQCDESFTPKLKNYSCEILQTGHSIKEEPAFVTTPLSNTRSHLEAHHNCETSWGGGIDFKSEVSTSTLQSRKCSKSIESLENVAHSAEAHKEQIIPKIQKFDTVAHELGNKRDMYKNSSVTGSYGKSRFTKFIKSHGCNGVPQQILLLTIHKIKQKYNTCRRKKYNQKSGVSLHLKNPGRTHKQSTWFSASGLTKTEEQHKKLWYQPGETSCKRYFVSTKKQQHQKVI